MDVNNQSVRIKDIRQHFLISILFWYLWFEFDNSCFRNIPINICWTAETTLLCLTLLSHKTYPTNHHLTFRCFAMRGSLNCDCVLRRESYVDLSCSICRNFQGRFPGVPLTSPFWWLLSFLQVWLTFYDSCICHEVPNCFTLPGL